MVMALMMGVTFTAQAQMDQQLPADPALHPDKGIRHHYEYEGWDWADLAEIIIRLSQTDTE